MGRGRFQVGVVLGLIALLALPVSPSRNCCCIGKVQAAPVKVTLPKCCAARLKRAPGHGTQLTSKCDCQISAPQQATYVAKPATAPSPDGPFDGIVLTDCNVEIVAASALVVRAPPDRLLILSRAVLCRWLV